MSTSRALELRQIERSKQTPFSSRNLYYIHGATQCRNILILPDHRPDDWDILVGVFFMWSETNPIEEKAASLNNSFSSFRHNVTITFASRKESDSTPAPPKSTIPKKSGPLAGPSTTIDDNVGVVNTPAKQNALDGACADSLNVRPATSICLGPKKGKASASGRGSQALMTGAQGTTSTYNIRSETGQKSID